MAKKKNPDYHYILVFTLNGPVYVTGIGDHHTAYWEKEKAPKCFNDYSDSYIRDMVIGLTWNGYNAAHVVSPYEINTHPYRYEAYDIEFVEKKESEEK